MLKVTMIGSQAVEVEEVVNAEVHEVREVEEQQVKRRFVNLTVSLSRAELPRVEKCCIFFDLRWGLNIWLGFEALIWFFLFIAAFYHEIVFAESFDLLDFYDTTQQWYFYLIFGDRLMELDQRTRSELKSYIMWRE